MIRAEKMLRAGSGAPIRILLLLAVALPSALLGQPPIPNGGFESGAVGEHPPDWKVTTPDGFSVALTDEGCIEGAQCAVISGTSEVANQTFGLLATSVDDASYILRRIRLRGAVRVENGSSAQMWLRVDKIGGGNSFFYNMTDQKIRSIAWNYYEIDAPVAADTLQIVFGVFLTTPGKGWVDDITLEVIGEIRSDPIEGPRALSAEGLDNLVAFAKLAGYVRYFHPSDQSVAADWETFIINGAREVEDADSSEELARRLEEMYKPVAPTVRLHLTGAEPPPVPELSQETQNATGVTRWFHDGLRIGTDGTVYQSSRMTVGLAENQPPALYGDPADTYNAVLGRGVSARVPTTLYADDSGTLPPGEEAGPKEEWDRTLADRAIRLANVIITWNVLQHFYPYMDITDVDMPAELRRALRSAAENTGPVDFLITMRKLMASIEDGHGSVTDGSRRAFAVPLVWSWVDSELVVLKVKDLQGQDVQPGDRVLKVDGVDVATVVAEIEELTSGATPQWIRLRAIKELARCDIATDRMSVEIEPFSAPGSRRTVEFDCSGSTSSDWTEPRPDTVTELEPGIIYVDLDRLTASQFAAALPSLQGAAGIVFDMRGYPEFYPPTWVQHLANVTARSEQFHIPTPRLPDQTDFTFREAFFALQPLQPHLTAKTVFLIDARAISQTETDLDWVEHYRLGELVGEATAGTTGNTNPFRLPGGQRVLWTGMKVLKQSGARFHGVGVRPTIPVSPTREGIAAGRDEVLEKGIEIAKGPQPGPMPSITAAGIVNAATFVGGAVAPGEMVTIFGAELGPEQIAHSKYDFSGYLENYAGDTRVFFDGIQAPLVYSSKNQVSAVVPYEVSATTAVRVEYQGRRSNVVRLAVAPAAPGLFAFAGAQAAVVNQDGSFNSTTNPARRGEIVTLFATGGGYTTPRSVTGKLPKAEAWPVPEGAVSVSFGGIPGEVVFSGSKTGVLQINVRVPAAAPAGEAVPVVLHIGSFQSSGERTLALQ
jgi:uncharacterized protein (TIGR03437 family)